MSTDAVPAPLTPQQALEKTCQKIKLNQYQKHIFICTGPKCCTEEQGAAIWEHLKNRLKETGWIDGQINRTKASCLRLCQQGPIAVVYPEGTWYQGVTPEVCDRILQEHCQQNAPVEANRFLQNPLKPATSPQP